MDFVFKRTYRVQLKSRFICTIMSNCGTCLFCRMKDLPKKFLSFLNMDMLKVTFPFTGDGLSQAMKSLDSVTNIKPVI